MSSSINMNPRSNFFSSLSHLEKRLKLEAPPPQHHHQDQEQEQEQTTAKPPYQETNIDTPQTESLGSPLYLYQSHPTSTSNPTSNLQESEPPQLFFTNTQTPEKHEKVQEFSDVNEIEMLLQLLGLGDEEKRGVGFGVGVGVGEGEDEVFYEKIVGVKGPKSEKEWERLNGWIKYLLNEDGDGGVKQPLRLAHLLLAKAAFVHMDDHDFQGSGFPPTVEDFLHYDPPVN